jgi:hypothetical protein
MRCAPVLIFCSLLALAGCGGAEAPLAENYAPLHYEFLKQLRLNVASVDVQDHSAPVGPQDVTAQDPVSPGQVLAQMGRDRLFPAGTAGKAVFVVDEAAITQTDGGVLNGRLAVHLDVLTDGGTRAAYAEAQVTRQHVPGSDPENLRNNLYDMTRQMMDDMNVELEFQVRHSLHAWLVTNTAVPAPVVATPLSPTTLAPPPAPVQPTPPNMSTPPSNLQPLGAPQ